MARFINTTLTGAIAVLGLALYQNATQTVPLQASDSVATYEIDATLVAQTPYFPPDLGMPGRREGGGTR